MTTNFIDELKGLDPILFERLNREITEEKIYEYLKPLADTYSPSQSVRYTRARVLQNLLIQDGVLNRPNVRFDSNYQRTGNSVILIGQNEARKQIWLLAHLDNISYLVQPKANGVYPLTPLCYHMMLPGKLPGVVISYNLDNKTYQPVSEGSITTDNEGHVFYEPKDGKDVRAGQRVCFMSEMSWDQETGEIKGSIDDAAGAVALVLAAKFLANYNIEVLLGLTDEEEGVAGESNQTICRGGARLLRYFDQPNLVIATDIHESAPMIEGKGPTGIQQGEGASFAEKASHNRGEITPPHLYEILRQLAKDIDNEGIRLRENLDGYLSRTEGVNAMLRTPNVALIGFLGENRHFQKEETTSNIRDLVDLAKSVVCLTLLTETPIWKEIMQD